MTLPLDSESASALAMTPFEFQMGTRILFGAGTVSRLGECAADLGARRVLIVSDPGIVDAGHVELGCASLREAGLEVEVFAGAVENPTTREVEAGVEVARGFQTDLLVGLGGGSSMDCAKGVNFLLTNGGRMQDYWGVGKATQAMLPMIAVPTTAGTGSELQSFALISDAETHAKMACGDKKATCRVAILDPSLTLTQPASVTALTGMDAISHAIETFVTRKRSLMSQTFSLQAWHLLCQQFPRVLEHPQDLEARAAVQLGASLAGLAIENSMLGAAHALANPLTAHFQIAHGQAVGVMLPHVVRFNAAVLGESYQQLEAALPESDSGMSTEPGEALAKWLQQILQRSGLKVCLSDLGIPEASLETLAGDADRQWTKGFNPRPLGESDLLDLYQAAWAA